MTGDQETALAAMIIFALLLAYVIGGSFIEVKHPPIGHETGIAILMGFLVSLLFFLLSSNNI